MNLLGVSFPRRVKFVLLSDSFKPPQFFPRGNVSIQRKLFHIKTFLEK